MPKLAISTDVYVPPPEVFSFLQDFPGYARYSPYLDRVTQHGDGGAGTQYTIDVAWWLVTYTAHTEVTDVVEPRRIGWRVVDGVDAKGAWYLDPATSAPDGTRVTLFISYQTDGAASIGVDIPRFVPIGTVIDRVKPVIHQEAKATVERIVEDLEGQPRDVTLTIDTDPEPPDQ